MSEIADSTVLPMEKNTYTFTNTHKYGMEQTEWYKKTYNGVTVKIAVTTGFKWVSFSIDLTPEQKKKLEEKGEFTYDDIKDYEYEFTESQSGCVD